MKMSLLISLFLLHFSFSTEAQTYANLPGPENVLVVYKLPDPNNSADTISQAVMNYYKDARQIPNSNIVALDNIFDAEIYDPETQTSHSIIIDQQGEIIRDNTILSYNPINRHSWIYFVDRIAEPIAHHLRTTIVNENRTAGSYEEVFDASQLASGVYVYKLQAGEFTASKKLMLLK